jgi:hypothetical protein
MMTCWFKWWLLDYATLFRASLWFTPNSASLLGDGKTDEKKSLLRNTMKKGHIGVPLLKTIIIVEVFFVCLQVLRWYNTEGKSTSESNNLLNTSCLLEDVGSIWFWYSYLSNSLLLKVLRLECYELWTFEYCYLLIISVYLNTVL